MFLDEILDEECVCIEKKSFRGVCDRNAVIRIRADGSTRKSSDGAVFLLYHSLCRLEALLGPAPLRVRAGSRDDASHGDPDLPLVLGMATGYGIVGLRYWLLLTPSATGSVLLLAELRGTWRSSRSRRGRERGTWQDEYVRFLTWTWPFLF